jgi:alpha-L-rhamnosidase
MKPESPGCAGLKAFLGFKLFLLSSAALAFFSADCLARTSLEVARLRCEYRVNPIGLDIARPRLSWTVESAERSQRQIAYQVLAASSAELLSWDKGDLWDSGKVISDQTAQVEYQGKPLLSRVAVWWKVRVWDMHGKPTRWSSAAQWRMGLLNPGDWQAQWITDPGYLSNSASAKPHNGYHSNWATNADAVKWITVDLGESQAVDAVRLFPARPYDWQPDTPGFLFPLRFKIEAADHPDFSDARTIVDRADTDQSNPGTNAPVFRFPEVQAQFIKLSVTRLRQREPTNFAFALAEIQVLHGETNLAEHAKVKAADSIETGAWTVANLTDGVVASVRPGTAKPLPVALLRKSFRLDQAPRRAMVYASALGVYELYINGRKVGRQLLAPEWTSYHKRVQYQAYDVTSLLHAGENAIAGALAEGWYAGRLMAVGPFAYGRAPGLLVQLECETAGEQRQLTVTDESWRSCLDGPIRSSGIYDGETYDASMEKAAWDMPSCDDHRWNSVRRKLHDSAKLVWQRNEPIEIEVDLPCQKLSEPREGVYVLDFGQNMVGWCRVAGEARKGNPVIIRHGEMLNEDGTLYTANLRGAPQLDHYIPAEDGEFSFEPRFTYHGFRYVQVEGLSAPPATNRVAGRVFHSAAPLAGEFACSDSSLNQLMRNVLWTERANLMSSPNDCPQRDERFGWMGDIQAFAQTAIFNMDLGAFFSKWTQDIRDDQADDGRFPDFAPHPGDPNKQFSGAPAWADAGVIVPWRAYQNYGDIQLLEETFSSAQRWVEYIHSRNPDLIWTVGRNNDYNDWLNGDWIKKDGWPSRGGSVPKEIFATAFFAHSTDLLSRMALVLGHDDEARRYSQLSSAIKDAFCRRFVKPDGRIEGDTQAGYALALNFDLLKPEVRPQAARHLVERIRAYQNHLSTGIQTTHRALLELSRYGHGDLAGLLVTNRTFPSWLYMIDNGATTVWERWDGYVKGRGFQDAGMNSFNHWAFGAVGEWIWRNLAGLNPDDSQPGWSRFTIAPRPLGGVTWANSCYTSIRGPIVTRWKLESDKFILHVSIPANTTATVVLPSAAAEEVREGGKRLTRVKGVRVLSAPDEMVRLQVQSGSYDFSSPAPHH